MALTPSPSANLMKGPEFSYEHASLFRFQVFRNDVRNGIKRQLRLLSLLFQLWFLRYYYSAGPVLIMFVFVSGIGTVGLYHFGRLLLIDSGVWHPWYALDRVV